MKNMTPSIALVDWNWKGHHPTYFKSLLEGFVKAGCRVAAFCPAEGWEEMAQITSKYEHVSLYLCRYHHPKGRLPTWFRDREHAWRLFGGLTGSFRKWERDHAASLDLVFFSTIYDFEFETIGFSKPWFSRPWSGIYLHARAFRMPGSPMPYFNRPPCPEKIFTHPALSSTCLIDEGAVVPMRALTKGKSAIEFPDITGTEIELPLEGYTLAGKLRCFANGRKTVVCLGHLQKTKGLIELCQVASDPRCADICFFFGGEVSWSDLNPDEVRFIQRTWEQSPNVLTHLTRLRDATMNALIRTADVVFAAYTNFPNSSNVMTKAAMLERPILVSDGHLMAERVRKWRLGAVVPEGSAEAMIVEIRRLCDEGGDPGADYKAYYANHSPEALHIALEKVVKAIG